MVVQKVPTAASPYPRSPEHRRYPPSYVARLVRFGSRHLLGHHEAQNDVERPQRLHDPIRDEQDFVGRLMAARRNVATPTRRQVHPRARDGHEQALVTVMIALSTYDRGSAVRNAERDDARRDQGSVGSRPTCVSALCLHVRAPGRRRERGERDKPIHFVALHGSDSFDSRMASEHPIASAMPRASRSRVFLRASIRRLRA